MCDAAMQCIIILTLMEQLGPDGEPLKRSSGPKHKFLPALASLTGVQADHRPQVQRNKHA
jgi:hypothetical protein